MEKFPSRLATEVGTVVKLLMSSTTYSNLSRFWIPIFSVPDQVEVEMDGLCWLVLNWYVNVQIVSFCQFCQFCQSCQFFVSFVCFVSFCLCVSLWCPLCAVLCVHYSVCLGLDVQCENEMCRLEWVCEGLWNTGDVKCARSWACGRK